MPETVMLMLPASWNFRNEADDEFGGIAGAFQNSAIPLPMTVFGLADVSSTPQSIAAAVLSIASIMPDGFMWAPYASSSPSTMAFLRRNSTASMPMASAMRSMCDSSPKWNSE